MLPPKEVRRERLGHVGDIATFALDEIEGGVHSDPMDPRRKRAVLLKGGKPVIGAQESLLGDLFSVLGKRSDAERDTKDGRVVQVNQNAKAIRVALERVSDRVPLNFVHPRN